MNLNNEQVHREPPLRYTLDTPFLTGTVARNIISHIPPDTEPVVICIGTDRSTGDSLGPLTGTLLKDRFLKYVKVYGTLDEPVHGSNLADKLIMIQQKHPNACIIAVDACLGQAKHIGTLLVGEGALKPGAALQKNLPPTGDLFIAGLVNVGGVMEYAVLQSTRLNLVMEMAKQISSIIKRIDYKLDQTLNNTHLMKKSNVIVMKPPKEPIN